MMPLRSARTLGDAVDEAARDRELAQRQLVVVTVVQHVQQVRVERVDVIHLSQSWFAGSGLGDM